MRVKLWNFEPAFGAQKTGDMSAILVSWIFSLALNIHEQAAVNLMNHYSKEASVSSVFYTHLDLNKHSESESLILFPNFFVDGEKIKKYHPKTFSFGTI